MMIRYFVASALLLSIAPARAQEQQEYSYVFLGTDKDGLPPPEGRFNTGPSLDGKGRFTIRQNQPLGDEPVLGPARPDSGAQTEQMGTPSP